jgi:hypothetical protein
MLDQADKFYQIDSLRKDTLLYLYTYDNTGRLKETRKNDTIYLIQGSRKSGKITVKKGDKELVIGFKNNQPYYVQNKEWGITLLEEDTVTKKEITELNASAVNNNSLAQNTEMTKAETRTTAMRPDRGTGLIPESSGGKNRSQRLKELYEEFKEVMEAKAIQHEWIWERL